MTWDSYLNDLSFAGDDGHDKLILLLVEADVLGVVKDAEKVGLDGVRVTGLTQNLQQRRVRHKEESWEGQTLLFQVTVIDRKKLICYFTQRFSFALLLLSLIHI